MGLQNKWENLTPDFREFLLKHRLKRDDPFIVSFMDVNSNDPSEFTEKQLDDYYEEWLDKQVEESWNK